MEWIAVVRWVHIFAAAAWFGEVVIINAVLVPSLQSISPEDRGPFIARLFPALFRLASVFALIVLLSGLAMSYLATEWRDLTDVLSTGWGIAILIGGTLGFLLAMFHFVVERRLRPIASTMDHDPTPEEVDQVMRFLRIAPRVGLVVISAAFLFMMVAARL